MRIPVKNIYMMLCYAWGDLSSLRRVLVGTEKLDSITNLFARILKECVNDLMRTGLWRDYVESNDEISAIRGKLAVTETIQKSLLKNGRAVCNTDEYTLNNQLNQFVFATIHAMISVKDLHADTRKELRDLLHFFRGVELKNVAPEDIGRFRIARHNKQYAHVIRVCALIWDQLAPDESKGHYIFEEFDRDEGKMRKVFEHFVRNFFRIEARDTAEVKSERFNWQYKNCIIDSRSLLPTLETDTSLISDDHYTVIETKYVPEALQKYRGSEKIRSAHINQLMVYLENIRRKHGVSPRGILLYPLVGTGIAEEYRIWDFDVRIRTLDLMQDWEQVRLDLVGLVAS